MPEHALGLKYDPAQRVVPINSKPENREYQTQIIEFDGWDSPLIEKEIGDRFTYMTEEKVEFALRGLRSVR